MAASTIVWVSIDTNPLTAVDDVPVYTTNKSSPVILSTPVTKNFFKYLFKNMNVMLSGNISLIFQWSLVMNI